MKRFLISVFALLSLFAFSKSSDKVPVTIITAVSSGMTSDGIMWNVPTTTSPDDLTSIEAGFGFYGVIEKTFDDIVDDYNEISKAMDGVASSLSNAVSSDGDLLFVSEVEFGSAYSYIMTFNNTAINDAMIKKWGKNSSSVADDDIEQNKKDLQSLKTASEKYGELTSRNKKEIESVKRSLESEKLANSQKLNNVFSQLKTLSSQIGELGADRDAIQQKISVLLLKQEAFIKNAGIMEDTINRIKNAQSSVVNVIGGGIVNVPPQVSTLSNQMDRISAFLLNDTAKTGYLNLPKQTITPPIALGNYEYDDDSETVKNIVQLMWQYGFMPFLPSDENASLGNYEGLWKKEGKSLYFNLSEKQTQDSEIEGTETEFELSANDIPPPKEWADNDTIIVTNGHFSLKKRLSHSNAWEYDNGKLYNCFVQCGRSCLAASSDGTVDASRVGAYYAVVTHGNMDSDGNAIENSLSISSSPVSNDDNTSCILIGNLSEDSNGVKTWTGISSMPLIVVYE